MGSYRTFAARHTAALPLRHGATMCTLPHSPARLVTLAGEEATFAQNSEEFDSAEWTELVALKDTAVPCVVLFINKG